MNKMIFYRIISIILLVVWSGVVFRFSAQTAELSGGVSGEITHRILCLVWKEYREKPPAEQEAVKNRIDKVVRKCAHFTVFAVLGCIAGTTAFVFGLHRAWAAVFCLLYAGSDEFHQFFIPGRSMELRDVCIDFCGALLGIWVMHMLLRRQKQKKNR